MKVLGAVVLVLFTGCASAWRYASPAAITAAVVTTACDFGQTESAATAGWSGGRTEGNDFMGETPSPGLVAVYFSGILITETLVAMLPRKWHVPLLGGVAVAETYTVAGNLSTTRGVCGL